MKYIRVTQLRRFTVDDPAERCGVVLRNADRTGVLLKELENIDVRPRDGFRFKLDDETRYSPLLMGFWHTHPGRDKTEAQLSMKDCNTAADWPYLFHLMYHPYTRTLVWYAAWNGTIQEKIMRVPYLIPRPGNLRY